MPCGIPCRAGYHAVRDTIPCGIPCRAGYRLPPCSLRPPAVRSGPRRKPPSSLPVSHAAWYPHFGAAEIDALCDGIGVNSIPSICCVHGMAGLTPATPPPGRGSPLRHSRQDGARPCRILTRTGHNPPHLHQDWAHPRHICTRTGPTPPHLRLDWADARPHLAPACRCALGSSMVRAAALPAASYLGCSVGSGHTARNRAVRARQRSRYPATATSAPGLGLARGHICTGTGLARGHSCTGTGLAPATSAPGLAAGAAVVGGARLARSLQRCEGARQAAARAAVVRPPAFPSVGPFALAPAGEDVHTPCEPARLDKARLDEARLRLQMHARPFAAECTSRHERTLAGDPGGLRPWCVVSDSAQGRTRATTGEIQAFCAFGRKAARIESTAYSAPPW